MISSPPSLTGTLSGGEVAAFGIPVTDRRHSPDRQREYDLEATMWESTRGERAAVQHGSLIHAGQTLSAAPLPVRAPGRWRVPRRTTPVIGDPDAGNGSTSPVTVNSIATPVSPTRSIRMANWSIPGVS
jgi:hypothetical protein